MTVPPVCTETRAAPLVAAASARTAPLRDRPLPATLPPERASEPFNLSGTAVAARALAAAPPVDAAKVASVRAGLDDGSYAVDPARIAAKMIALDLP